MKALKATSVSQIMVTTFQKIACLSAILLTTLSSSFGLTWEAASPIRTALAYPTALPSGLKPPTSFTGSAIGRVSRLLAAAELARLALPSSETPRKLVNTRRGDFFDLWGIADQVGAGESSPALVLSFSLEAEEDMDVFLLLGGCDNAIVFCNQKASFGVLGERDHSPKENSITLHFKKGVNSLSVLCFKEHPWRNVPRDHFSDEWSLDISAYRKSDAAWDAVTAICYHPLDTPIVGEWSDLRVSTFVEGHKQVRAWSTKGKLLNTGLVQSEGTINWNQRFTQDNSPYVGLLSVGDICEAVVITGGKGIDDVCMELLADSSPLESISTTRARHIVATRVKRDRWWARKLALELCRREGASCPEASMRWPSDNIRWYKFISNIDHTEQYYRELDAHGSDRVAVILPGVPRPVRPHLESYSVADIKEEEQLAAVANSAGVSILWPGNVDVDYGGALTRWEIKECLEDVGKRTINQRKDCRWYLVGTCSAGVSAIGYANSFGKIAGVVLWSPEIRRVHFKWGPGLPGLHFKLPPSVMNSERTDDVGLFSKELPCYLLYDINVAGHGDRVAAEKFVNELRLGGGKISSEFLESPDAQMQWGMRAMAEEERWLEWITKTDEGTLKVGVPTASRVQHLATIKEFLIADGLALSDCQEPAFQAWRSAWEKALMLYRGSPPKQTSRPPNITFRLAVGTAKEAIVSIFTEGTPQLRFTESSLPPNLSRAGFFGVRMTSNPHGEKTVEIVTNVTNRSVPPVDLLLDCPFGSGLWGLIDDKWTLLQVWL